MEEFLVDWSDGTRDCYLYVYSVRLRGGTFNFFLKVTQPTPKQNKTSEENSTVFFSLPQ